MTKRRRLFTPLKNRTKPVSKVEKEENEIKEMITARGRLKGALIDALGPVSEESDASSDYGTQKWDGQGDESSEEEEERSQRRQSPPRQSYVLKLFDRSVDLSQFSEDSPLYPICRAWMINQPKTIYKQLGKHEEPKRNANSVDLPGPEGPPISKIPALLPEQLAADKNNVNLNYQEAPPPCQQELIRFHSARWAGVRSAWLAQAARAEARHRAAQELLNKINVNSM